MTDRVKLESSGLTWCESPRTPGCVFPPPPGKGGVGGVAATSRQHTPGSRDGCREFSSYRGATRHLQPPSVPPSKGGKEYRGLRIRLGIWLPKLVWAGVRVALLTLFFSVGCASKSIPETIVADPSEPPELLSSYGLFHGNGASQQPVAGVVAYDVNTPLFSDYAHKLRFVKLPAGASAKYDSSGPFDFPIGTILIKTFLYPFDERDPAKGRRLIETRLLTRHAEGWKGLAYVWNDEQTEAKLRIVGADKEVHWIDKHGQDRQVKYMVPNTNQCMGCHENNKVIQPIGPTARNLNRDFDYAEGRENQLEYWAKHGLLQGAPSSASAAPRLPVWNDPKSGSLEARARAWLESNCAHCHNPLGPARTSGLDLTSTQQDLFQRGFWKPPVAAGRGSGGRSFGIVPGQPDRSILMHRIESREPGVMMPELARRLVDEEGVALIRAWIASLPSPENKSTR